MHEWACCHEEAANHQLPIAAAFWIIQIVSLEECSTSTQNSMQICCSTHSFWMQWPHSTHAHSTASTDLLTSTVKSSLFMHAHSSPLSLASKLHWCHTNCSHYIDNGWTFSGQTLYIKILIFLPVCSKFSFPHESSLGLSLCKTILFSHPNISVTNSSLFSPNWILFLSWTFILAMEVQGLKEMVWIWDGEIK